MHVMYDPNYSDVIGVYIRTSTCISDRIQGDIGTKGSPVRSKESLHYKFWNQEGIQDFWIVLGTFTKIPFKGSKDQYPILPNILKFYAMLAFRNIRREILRI